jgi:hypothetical protein
MSGATNSSRESLKGTSFWDIWDETKWRVLTSTDEFTLYERIKPTDPDTLGNPALHSNQYCVEVIMYSDDTCADCPEFTHDDIIYPTMMKYNWYYKDIKTFTHAK